MKLSNTQNDIFQGLKSNIKETGHMYTLYIVPCSNNTKTFLKNYI